MLAEIYDALIEAGSSESKARAAAEAIAAYDNQLRIITNEVLTIKSEVYVLKNIAEHSVVESRVVRGIIATIILGILWRVW